MPMQTRVDVRQRGWWIVVGTLWLAAVVTGLAWVAIYDNRPGAAATSSETWPVGTLLARDVTGPTLVMLAHPRCTCTEASIAELAEVMARARPRPRAFVVFIKPGSVGDEWDRTGLRAAAEAIPGVTAVRDDEGLEAQRFGAETSGQTFLYDAGGRLLFSGGTTGSRGHAGENAGRAAILALLDRKEPDRRASSVFGCSLFAPDGPHPFEESTSDGPQSR